MNVGQGNGVNVAGTTASTLSQTKSKISAIDEKVYKAVVKTFKFLKKLILFPTRYIGGKDFSLSGLVLRLPKSIILYLLSKDKRPENALFGSGYHRAFEKTLTPKEGLQFVKYASVSNAQHRCDKFWINSVGLEFYDIQKGNFDLKALPGNIEINKDCFCDVDTGLKATISYNANEVIVSFGAVDSFGHLHYDNENLSDVEKDLRTKKSKMTQYKAAAKNILGVKPKHYRQADALFQLIKNHPDLQGKDISLTGQCYGGSIAEYIAIKNKVPAVCFNTLQMGAGLQEELGNKRLSHADEFVTHVSVTTDVISDNRYLVIFDRFLSLIGIRTPGNFGKHYTIPTAYGNQSDTHQFMMGSLMKHLGYDIKSGPDVLQKDDMDIVKNIRPANFAVKV